MARRLVRKPRQSSSTKSLAPSGSGPFGRPEFQIPDLPIDITVVSDDRLMQLFSEYVQWQNYAATEFALAEVAEAKAEANVRRIEAEGLILAPSSAKVTDTKAAINTTVEMREARDRVLDAYASRKLNGVMKENCERTASLLSRELSRRIGGADVQRRQMRWQP
jgi:hypothetical protein